MTKYMIGYISTAPFTLRKKHEIKSVQYKTELNVIMVIQKFRRLSSFLSCWKLY